MEEKKLLKKKHQLRAKGTKLQLATICNDLAELYSREGKYDRSIEEYKQEAQLYEEIGKRILYAKTNRMIGEIYTTLAEFGKALKHENIHLNIAREENNELEEQRALASIGRTYLTKGINDADADALSQANKSFMKSLMICERLKDISKQEQMDMRARLFLNIGVVQEHQGNYVKATEYMKKSINICKTHEIYEQLHQGYLSLGFMFRKMNDFEQAIANFNLAIDVAKRLSDKIPPLCTALFSKAETLIKLAEFQNAKVVLLKAYKLKTPNVEERNSIEHSLKVVAAMCYAEDTLLTTSNSDYKTKKKLYEKMGDGACDLKNFEKAIDYYKKMLECAEKCGESGKDLIPVYVSLAQTYKDNKQYDLAVEYFKKEYEVSRSNPKESYSTLLNIAEVLEQAKRSYDEIIVFYTKARTQAQATGIMKIEAKAIIPMIHFLKRFNKFTEANELEKELVLMDYVASDDENDESDVDSAGTPDIGDDINIEDITDLSEDSDLEGTGQPRTTRKRGRPFTVKKNNKGETQLHTACIHGNLTLVRGLLDQGHPVNIRDNCGWLPIHEACNYGYKEVIELLLEKGSPVNDRGGKLCNGVTPLHDAASNGHLEVIELMMEHGASPIAQTDNGETPLDMLELWRSKNTLDPIEQSFYETIVSKMKAALDKAGRSTVSKPIRMDKENIYTEQKSPEKTRRSPRKTTPLKQIGSLRYSVDIPDDDLDPIPSCSGLNRNLFSERTSLGKNSNRSSSPDSDTDVGRATRNEYKQVMDNLRKRLPEPKHFSPKGKTKKSALLADDDIGDDWLEDDLGLNQPVKKRRTNPNVEQNFLNSTGIRRSNSFNSSKGSTSPAKKSVTSPTKRSVAMDTNSDSDFEAPTEIITRSEEDSNDGSNSSSNFGSNKRKSQTSLLESGFSRRRSDNSLNISAVTHVSKISNKSHKWQQKISSYGHVRDNFEPDSTTVTNMLDSSQFLNNRSVIPVNVRIDGKLWRVPVPAFDMNNLNIGWLAKEAAQRFYKIEGISPNLQLESKEGAIYMNEDPLSMISFDPSQPEEVQSTILSWNLPPLPDRYVEACSNGQIDVNPKLRERLDECNGTLNLNLVDFRLPKMQLTPLFRSLNRQNNLQYIDLSGNGILNEGVQQLCSALPSLTQLRSLNLSLNNVTAEGLRYISEIFNNPTSSILEHLIDLNLSYNLLGDDSLRHLNNILKHIKLRVLNLSACNLTGNIFENISNHGVNLNFEHLQNFDISMNALNSDSVIMFISFLNFNVAADLNFSHNTLVKDSGIVKELAVNLQQAQTNNIRSLNLAACKANDSEIWELLRSLSQTQELECLNLSYNNDLTSVTLRRLIQHRPSFSSLVLEGCFNIIQYLDHCTSAEFYQTSLKSLKISLNYTKHPNEANILTSMWEREWGIKAKVEKLFGSFLRMSVTD